MKKEKKKPSAIVIYHFFYPDDVISARHFSQFAEELVNRGWDVNVFTGNRYCRYPDRKIAHETEWWNGIFIKRLKRPGWNQANNYLRLLNSAWLMIGWTIKLMKTASADVIIIGTDPQFSALLFPTMRILKRGKILVHWCYDLFPEAILADGARGTIKLISERLFPLMRWAYRSVDIMVDIGQCMRKCLEVYEHGAQAATLMPWALVEPDSLREPDLETRRELFGDARLTLLYSGNMGKAHDFSLFLKLARRLYAVDPRIVLCFACRGNRFEELKSAVRPTDCNIRFASFADESELGKRLNAADIHLLSLRDGWEGVVVPSKFFGSLAVGRPVIYAGPETSAIAQWIRKFDIGLILTKDNMDQVIKTLLEIASQAERLRLWQTNAFQVYRKYFSKKQIMDQWDNLLRNAIKHVSPAIPGAERTSQGPGLNI